MFWLSRLTTQAIGCYTVTSQVMLREALLFRFSSDRLMPTISSESRARQLCLELTECAAIGTRGSITATTGGLAAMLGPHSRAILEYEDELGRFVRPRAEISREKYEKLNNKLDIFNKCIFIYLQCRLRLSVFQLAYSYTAHIFICPGRSPDMSYQGGDQGFLKVSQREIGFRFGHLSCVTMQSIWDI